VFVASKRVIAIWSFIAGVLSLLLSQNWYEHHVALASKNGRA
jgi:hypothetical protein